MAGALDRLEPGFGRAVLARGDFFRAPAVVAGQGESAVGAGPDADVVAVAPVGQVVPAFGAGARVVGDLVGRQAGRGQQVPRGLEDRHALVLSGQDQLAAPPGAVEGRARLDGQLIDREVLRRLAQRPAKLGAPGGRALPGPRGNQVEGPAREERPRDLEGGKRLGGAVLAPEKA